VSTWQICAFIWAVSAALALEAYGELYGKQAKDKWLAILLGALTPVVNTCVAWCYARQKLKGLSE
jgi:hypothetical protein